VHGARVSLTATELAYCANVSRSTASGHLSKLVAARLLTVTRKRRFSYYRVASPLVPTMLESIKVVAFGLLIVTGVPLNRSGLLGHHRLMPTVVGRIIDRLAHPRC
jgi:DNA-binding transcriptional ArsR family regulator